MSEEQKIGTLTRLIAKAGAGEKKAQSDFADMVYQELHEAAKRLVWRRGGGSLQPTALVNEFFLKLCSEDCLGELRNRRYFFTTAIDQMQKILIDHHRHKKRLKRGGHLNRVPLDENMNQLLNEFEKEHGFDIEALEKALEDLRRHSERQYEVVRYRFFGGLTNSQTAEILEVSVGTVERDWRLARAKLYDQLRVHEK